MPRFTVALCLLAAAGANAATLRTTDLPHSIASRLATGVISAEIAEGQIVSYASGAGFSAYAFDSERGGAFTLVAYDVLAGSLWDTGFSAPLPQTGQIFLEAPLIYAGGAAEFTLHFDALDPGIPSTAFWSGLPMTTLVLQPGAVTTGTGVYMFSGDPDYIESGTMDFVGEGPFLCIECAFFAQLDLVFLDYSTGFLQFDPDDSRTTLFTGFDTFDTTPYGWGLNIVVQPVPVPAALPLLLGALALIAPWMRRRAAVL